MGRRREASIIALIRRTADDPEGLRAKARALAARGESPAAFGRRCIPPGCVAPRSNIPDILARRALPKAVRVVYYRGLGATPDFHHGLLAQPVLASTADCHPRAIHARPNEADILLMIGRGM